MGLYMSIFSPQLLCNYKLWQVITHYYNQATILSPKKKKWQPNIEVINKNRVAINSQSLESELSNDIPSLAKKIIIIIIKGM